MRIRSRSRRLLAALAMALAPAMALAFGPAGTEASPPLPERELNDPGRLSHWAFVVRSGPVRARPSARARVVGRLRTRTGDGTDELVPMLGALENAAGRTWVRVRFRHRPNGVTGWVPRRQLGQTRRSRTWVRVDLSRRRLVLVRSGRIRLRAPVGVGQARWPTPRGEFYVRNRLRGFSPGSIYGPFAFGTNATSDVLTDWPGGGVVGLHGTNQPDLIPGAISHGCIRLRNRDILALARLVSVGTPITIR